MFWKGNQFACLFAVITKSWSRFVDYNLQSPTLNPIFVSLWNVFYYLINDFNTHGMVMNVLALLRHFFLSEVALDSYNLNVIIIVHYLIYFCSSYLMTAQLYWPHNRKLRKPWCIAATELVRTLTYMSYFV